MRITTAGAMLKRVVRLLGSVEKNVYPLSLAARKDIGTGSGSVTIETLEHQKFVSISFSADVMEEGNIIFTSRYLPYLDTDHDTVTIYSRKDYITVRGAYDYNIPHYAGEVPRAPSHLPVGSATFSLGDIKGLFKRVLFAVGDDSDPHHNFRCIRLECKSDALRAVGGDRRVFALSQIPKGSPYVGNFTLPKGGVYFLNKLEGDLITLTFYDNAIRFTVSGEIMCDVLMPELAVQFPNYSEFLDIRGNTVLEADTSMLMTHISAVRKVSDKLFLSLKYDGRSVKQPPRLFAREDEGQSQFNAFIEGEWSGTELKLALNARTFMEAVSQAGSKVKVSFTNDMGPLAVTGEGDGYMAVMLPYSPVEKR
jgi:hypothetical protein